MSLLEQGIEELKPINASERIYVGERTKMKIFRNTIANTTTFAIISILLAAFFIVAAFFIKETLRSDALAVFIPIIAILVVIALLLFIIRYVCKRKLTQNRTNQNPAIEVFKDKTIILCHIDGLKEKIQVEDIIEIKGKSFKYFVFAIFYVFYGSRNYGKVILH